MAYKNKYKIPYRELKTNVLWEAYIMERDYTGSTTTLKGCSKPSICEYRPENDNDYDWIRPSVCTLSMISETDMQFIEFFTSDDRKYKVRVYRNSVLMWAGYVIPETYKEPYGDVKYEVSISATDGILSLKDVSWEPVNDLERQLSSYRGMKSLMKGIESTLGKLHLTEIRLWDASYIYESHMDADDSPFSQSYFNCNLFYDEKGQPAKCYDVLKVILQTQNCQLWMENGAWNIVPQNARKGSYLRRQYVFTGATYTQLSLNPISSETFDPNVVIDGVNYHLYATPTLSFRPAWKEVNIVQDYGFKKNILSGNIPYFSDDFDGGIDEEGNVCNGSHYDESETWRDDYIMYNVGDLKKETNQRLKIKFNGHGSVTNIPFFIYLVSVTNKRYMLSDAGVWDQTSVTNYNYTTRNIATWDKTWDEIAALDVLLTNVLPEDGALYIKILAIKGVYISDYRYDAFYNLTDFIIEITSSSQIYENKKVKTVINELNTYIPETIELKLGDCEKTEEKTIWKWDSDLNGRSEVVTINIDVIKNINQLHDGILYYYHGSGGDYYTYYKLTELWTVRDRNQYNRLVNVIADEIAVNHVDPQWIISGDLLGVMGYGSILAIGTKKYMMLRGEHNQYENEWNAELFEIADTEQGYLKLRTGGYIKLRTGDKIKVK